MWMMGRLRFGGKWYRPFQDILLTPKETEEVYEKCHESQCCRHVSTQRIYIYAISATTNGSITMQIVCYEPYGTFIKYPFNFAADLKAEQQ
jgi:hypothetical protein